MKAVVIQRYVRGILARMHVEPVSKEGAANAMVSCWMSGPVLSEERSKD